ncbi:MAG: carbon starvation protein A [Armatimonadota bacterium]|nr:MAG: carbon starvation protein A [Armatimonadota bacterium]
MRCAETVHQIGFGALRVTGMPISVLLVTVIIAFFIAYRWYGRWLERRVASADPARFTPARTHRDGLDFVPTPIPVLFGHHFASIAGAGPILGPVLAVGVFGWAPVVLWVVLGAIVIGGVHDYLTLMVSVRNGGASIADVGARVIGRRARAVFAAFLWAALVLVITVFAVTGAKAMMTTPQIVIPTFSLILIAIAFGWAHHRMGINLALATALAVVCNFFFIYLGYLFPVSLPTQMGPDGTLTAWFAILIGYGLVASVLPVWLLLQPRDYICIYKLVIGMGLGVAGVFATFAVAGGQVMVAPAFTSFSTAQGLLWPMMFIIVACGAVSGFHSLVAGGTTAKQLSSERHARGIGYGGMLVEGLLATIAVIAVGAGLTWRGAHPEMAGQIGALVSGGGEEASAQLQALITPQEGVAALGLQDLLGNPLVAFALGYGRIVSRLPFLGFAAAFLLGMIVLKTFILTTLDTATRLGRFIFTESLGRRSPLLANRWVGGAVTIGAAAAVGLSNSWQAVWPVFASANQLIAALTLMIISAYLVGTRRPSLYTLLPALFMSATTIVALLSQSWLYFTNPEGVQWVLGVTCVILLLLAAVVIGEATAAFRRLRSGEALAEAPAMAPTASDPEGGPVAS